MTHLLRLIGLCGSVGFFFYASAGVQAQGGSLTGATQIARVYDAILDARFDEVPTMLQQTCSAGSAPPNSGRPHPVVCQLLGVVNRWWQIQLDPLSTARDAAFERTVNEVIAAAEAWTRTEPTRAEAWFYLGGAYGARGQWRVLRGEALSAARDGKRIKESLERALALDPNLKDAYFGIGLYHYYADVAPAAAKMLRFLFFLPGGDKVQGMREMQQAREGGQLLRSEADYQLHLLYLWYENQPLRARDLIAVLASRYPRNPHFPQLIAEINDTYLHDDTASLRAWQAMLTAAQTGRLAQSSMAAARARLGLAEQLDRLYESDRALEHLRSLVQSQPAAPFGVTSQATLLLARVLDRMGARNEATIAYRQVLAAASANDPHKVAPRARAGLRTTPNVDTARAYRLSLEGWRALEAGALADASRLLSQSLALRPDDAVTKYRQARLLLAQDNDSSALPLLEQAAAARSGIHPALQGYACIEAATLFEQRGQRQQAVDYYTRVTSMFGADERSKISAQRALSRLSGEQRRSAVSNLTHTRGMDVGSATFF